MTSNTHISTQKTISRQCFLQTEGYQIVFNFNSLEIDQQDIDLIVEFHLDSNLGYVALK